MIENNNEWESLEIDDLPSDILTGDYEFEFYYPWIDDPGWSKTLNCKEDNRIDILRILKTNKQAQYRYRKRQMTVEDMAEDAYYYSIRDVRLGGRIDAKEHYTNAYITGYKAAKDERD